ncbi:MAG: M28 family peptidase [Candidatus Thorarchaeota archaeon]
MIMFGARTMKQLWVFIFLGLMLMVQPVYSTPVTMLEDNVIVADAPPAAIQRVYGEDISSQIYSDVSTTQYRDIVEKFTENGSRWIMDYSMAQDGDNYYARQYLKQQLTELSNGRIEIEEVGDHFNIVGKLPGYLPDDNQVIVVSAHYDSAANSPGANADGSGIASVLSLARMLSKYQWPLDIYFIAFNGLYTFDFMSGSPEVGNRFQQDGIDILTMYNLDTLLFRNPFASIDERLQIGYVMGGQVDYHLGQYWAELTRMLSNNIGYNYIVPIPSINFPPWQSTDQFAFFERGFTGLLCGYESGASMDDVSSTPDDRWDNGDLNYNLGREMTSVVGASIAFTMSRRYGAPTQLTYSPTIGGGNVERYYIPITTPTRISVTSRWFGGTSTYSLLDPDSNPVAQKICNYTSPWEAIDIFNTPVTTKGLYTLIIENTYFSSIGFEISITYDTDIDGNDIIDQDEYWLDPSYFVSDQDNDNVTDADEIFLGIDMYDSDSDGDMMDDRYEIDMGFDPADPSDGNEDTDGDGLTNSQEYSGGLNPLSADSDGDQMDDYWELSYGLDPLVDDADLDLDEDNITNLEEYLAGTDPSVSNVESIPIIWFVSPVLVIAPIVAFLYIRRRNNQLLS